MPESWGDVPPGMPVHHHCVLSIEGAHHPKHWVDAANATPHFVAWQPQDAVSWVREQLIKHRDQANESRDRGWIDETLACYQVPPVPGELPRLWGRLRGSLSRGGWTIETYQLESRQKLVFQILGYADQGQPSQSPGREYTICSQHRRPEESPYLGLGEEDRRHFIHYGSIQRSEVVR